MAGKVQISVTNLLAGQTPVELGGRPVNANYPISNFRTPERGLKLWKSTALPDHAFSWDLGGTPAGPYGFLAVGVNVNAPILQVNGDSDPAFSPALSINSVSVFQDPQNGRWGFGRYFRTWPYRYLMLYWPGTVAPTDGQGVYQSGGFWFGPCLNVPTGLLGIPGSAEPMKPRQFNAAQAGTFEEYADLGPPRAQWVLGRRAKTNRGFPAAGDELEKWLAVDRQWGGRPAAILLNSESTRYAYIARNLGELAWGRNSAQAATNTIRVMETLGP